MTLDVYEIIAMLSAIAGILILGTTLQKLALLFYALHTLCLGVETAWIAHITGESHLYVIATGVIVLKAIAVPVFLSWIVNKLQVPSDTGMYLPAPLVMHLSIGLLGASYILSEQIPGLHGDGDCRFATTAAMSILFSGVLLMLTRKVAISQILGFLVIENGIYLFALAQTKGMPFIVEMGFMLEVLVGVMISGLLLFNIKKSFEHIDVTQLTELQEEGA